MKRNVGFFGLLVMSIAMQDSSCSSVDQLNKKTVLSPEQEEEEYTKSLMGAAFFLGSFGQNFIYSITDSSLLDTTPMRIVPSLLAASLATTAACVCQKSKRISRVCLSLSAGLFAGASYSLVTMPSTRLLGIQN